MQVSTNVHIPVFFSTLFLLALKNRNYESPSNDLDRAISLTEQSRVALDSIMSEPEWAEIADKLVRQARIADKRNPDYFAVKALCKLITTLQAMVTGQASQLDNYTFLVGYNTVKNASLTNKSGYMSLCKSIEYDSLDRIQTITRASGRGYTVGTASSQTGQVRMLLKYMGIAEVSKGKRDDCMVLLDNPRANRFASLFGIKRTSAPVQPAQPADVVDVPAISFDESYSVAHQ